jgi:hypothetical protein
VFKSSSLVRLLFLDTYWPSPESLEFGWEVDMRVVAEVGCRDWEADWGKVVDSSRTGGLNEGSLMCSGYFAAHFS